jgi:hypothetical protein
MRILICRLSLLGLLLVPKIYAQDFISGSVQYGQVIPRSPFLQGENSAGQRINPVLAGRLELGWQANGADVWERLYNYPYSGFGIYAGSFGNGHELGSPVAVFAYFGFPISRFGDVNLALETGLGLAFNWRPYDPQTNPWNVTIGAHLTDYIDIGLVLNYKLSPQFDVYVGQSITHFSNSAVVRPNDGVNTFATKAGTRWHLRRPEYFDADLPIPEFRNRNFIEVNLAFGTKNTGVETTVVQPTFAMTSYGNISLSAFALRQFGHTWKFGAGLEVMYDASIASLYKYSHTYRKSGEPAAWKDQVLLSGLVSYRQVVSRFQLVLQLGYYFWQREIPYGDDSFFQDVGLQYAINDKWEIGLHSRLQYFSNARNATIQLSRNIGL